MKIRRAIVRLDGVPVGKLAETGNKVGFVYDPEWLVRRDAVPVSLTLPLRTEPDETVGV